MEETKVAKGRMVRARERVEERRVVRSMVGGWDGVGSVVGLGEGRDAEYQECRMKVTRIASDNRA